MEIKKIKGALPYGFSNIEGTDRWIYQVDTTVDFYDNNMLAQIGTDLPGSEILFISFPEGKIYKPFEREKGIYYDKPAYFNGRLFFIKVDFNKREVFLLKYFEEENTCQELFTAAIDDIDLYNLNLAKSPIMLYSQGQSVEIYYPQRLSLKKEANESFIMRKDDDFYFYSWVEEGLERSGSLGEDYKYYEEIIIKDKNSKVLKKEKGNIFQMPNGDYWAFTEE